MGRMKDKYMEYLEKVEAEAEDLRDNGQYGSEVVMHAAAEIVKNPLTERDHRIKFLLGFFHLDSEEAQIEKLAKDMMPWIGGVSE